jgi:hypothetical protein
VTSAAAGAAGAATTSGGSCLRRLMPQASWDVHWVCLMCSTPSSKSPEPTSSASLGAMGTLGLRRGGGSLGPGGGGSKTGLVLDAWTAGPRCPRAFSISNPSWTSLLDVKGVQPNRPPIGKEPEPRIYTVRGRRRRRASHVGPSSPRPCGCFWAT